MKMRICNKILITICFLILLSLVGQVVFNQFFSKKFFLQKQKNIISEAFQKIQEEYDEDLTNVDSVAGNLQDMYGIKTVISDNGEIVYSSGYSFFMQGPKPAANPIFHTAKFTASPKVILIKGRAITGDMERLQLGGMFYHNNREVLVLLTLQIASIDNSIAVFTESNIYISLAVMLLGILIALFVSQNITAPITTIEEVSKKIAALDFSCTADEENRTVEIASLAQSVNQMSQQLAKSMKELTIANQALQKDINYRKQIEALCREFIANVSHEMKTPLSLLQIYAENLKSNIYGIDKDYYCDTILEETEKLNQMVSEMLEISSIESGFIQMNFEKLNLSEFSLEILHQYQPILEKYQTEIKVENDIVVSGDRKYLEQVMKNILNNAVQHTKEGDPLHIQLKCSNHQVTLEIYNCGTTISEEDLAHVWSAFYRTDKARTYNSDKNVGLGLYIVKTVMKKHNGSCYICNRSNGVAVGITLNVLQKD